jgi:hypothetical protein
MEERAKNKNIDLVSTILSIIFHPVFIPVYGLLVIFYSPTFMVHLPAQLKRIMFFLVAINMTFIPLAMIPLMKFRNIISSYHMDTRSERILPLALASVMYVVTAIIFHSYQIPVIIKSFMMAAAIVSVIVLATTFFWKISVHAACMGALLATAAVLSLRMRTNLFVVLIPLILLSGMVMSARLYLSSHRPAQVYSGFLLAFFTVFLVMMIS